MLHRRLHPVRRGATVVESAFAYSATFILVAALLIGAMGVFRYQEVAALAREGARWASVHGAAYAEENGKPAATATDVYETAVKPQAVGLDKSKLSCSVTWNTSNRVVTVTNDVQNPKGNTVSVTVSYQWLPELLLVGPFNLTSTSTVQMCY
jgi:hypothetical protein